jgi:guanosine-3',5'-bis(diphosphate) 3'-pyrophosphohydrolase
MIDHQKEKQEFISKAGSFFEEKALTEASLLLDEIIELQLDLESMRTGFFLYADISHPFKRKELSELIGEKTVQRIELLKRLSGISVPETKKKILKLRQLFVELSDDLSVIFIKLAERLYRLKQCNREKNDSLKRLAEECLYLYAPIAHRLGIRKIYSEMEDISFKVLFPDDYNKIYNRIERKRPKFIKNLEDMTHQLLKVLKEHNIEAKIYSRVKKPYSIFRKLKNKNVTFDEIFDLMALRVITQKVDDCYLTLGVVHSHWIPIAGRFRDWVTYPKPNGYRSIQTTIHTRSGHKYEIQIRTEEMHREAEYGSAAHWAYKEGVVTQDTWIMRLKEFLENDEYFDDPYQLFDLLKSEFKRDFIHVLTPKGDIKTLPEGSTPIDFAFAVHTDLGYKVIGARVNGKFAKLKTELKSGDVVDILSSNNATPSLDWLSFVKTSRTRNKIMKWFNKHERENKIIEGKKTYDALIKRYRNKVQDYLDGSDVKNNLIKLGVRSFDDLYFEIAGKGIKASLQLLKKIYPKAFKKDEAKSQINKGKNKKDFEPKIKVEGMSGLVTKFAKCCNPVKGEPIIAYVTKKSEVKIHSKDCQYIKKGAFDTSNFKKAEWVFDDSMQEVSIKVFGDDFNKMMKTTVDAADDLKLPIISTNRFHAGARGDGLLIRIRIKGIEDLNRFNGKLLKFKAY